MNEIPTTYFAGQIIFWIDVLGTFVFAISGIIRGWQVRFNVVGVVFLAAVTACGGGTIRDMMGGKPVPFFLQEPLFLFLIVLAVLLMYAGRSLIFWLEKTNRWTGFENKRHHLTAVLELCDAIGLAVFAVIGARFALTSLQHPSIAPFIETTLQTTSFALQPYAVILFAVLTGAGGGVIRDVVANRRPYAFSASYYALFPAFGGVVFYGLFLLGNGDITALIVILSVLLTGSLRILHWKFGEFEREQFSAVVLFRDEGGKYLMEEGRSGYLSLIGGKWQEQDGSLSSRDTLRKTASRETLEELGLRVPAEDFKRLPLDGTKDRHGNMLFRERSLRTGETVLYHIAIFDYKEKLSTEALEKIRAFRESPVLARDRIFTRIDPKEISLQIDPKIHTQEGSIAIDGREQPISYSMLRRIKQHLAEDVTHADSSPVLKDLPEP